MQVHRHRNKLCGTQVPQQDRPPVEEVLNSQVEIFSCGGVYLGLQRPLPEPKASYHFLTLPKMQRNLMVLNHHKVHRRPGDPEDAVSRESKEPPTPQQAMKRFFKESLN